MKKNFITNIIKKDIKNQNYKKIITRFPPEPNGYLHIGHAKSIYINFNIAKKYNGQCNLRFDDTNPKKEKKIYVKSIKKNIKWLGYKWYKKIKYSSNYFNIYYNYALQLIKKKLAYVEELSIKEIKKYRGTYKIPGRNSPYRERNIESNLKLFENMKNGLYKEKELCLRAKINMKSKHMILRDPILYRIIKKQHYKTQNKWNIYPMYDFAHCIADYIEKITHSICTLEFQNNRYLYEWILNNLNIKTPPKQYEFSKLNLTYTLTSKRKINKLIKKKIVSGWDDPRLMTISGMKKRGFTPTSIKKFCKSLGISKQENIIDIKILEKYLKKELNNKTHRIMAILEPLKVNIINLKKKKTIKTYNHPKNKNMGFKKIILTSKIYIEYKDFKKKSKNLHKLTLGGKIKLRHTYIIKCVKIIKNKKNKISHLECKISNIKNKKNNKIGIIHWVSRKYSIQSKFNLYNKLFTIKNPNKEKNFISKINKKSIIIKYGYIENNIKKNIYQFERIGYFKKNKKDTKLTFNQILKL